MVQRDGTRRLVMIEARPHGVMEITSRLDEVRVQLGAEGRIISTETNIGMVGARMRGDLPIVTLVVAEEVVK